MITKHVRGVREDKKRRLDDGATRPSDMPLCVDCRHVTQGAAVAGYDGQYRCLACNEAHAKAVLRESGDSAPNASEERPGRPAAPEGEAAKARREARVKATLEKYGVAKRT